MHKKIKLFVSTLAAAAMLVLLPGSNAMTAKAEGNTYSVKYIGGDINNWRYVSGSTFEDGANHLGLVLLMSTDLKDGDNIVIYPGDVDPGKPLDLGSFKLSSLTVHQNVQVVVSTGGVKDCYVLAGANTAINGEVTYAHLYETTICTFNNNVLDMTLHLQTNDPHSNISCAGTVGCFRIDNSAGAPSGEYYSIPKNTMRYENGAIQFANWSAEPTEEYLQAKETANETPVTETPAASETPAATETPTANTANGSAPAAPVASAPSDEYDRVPKTGDNNNLVWPVSLIGIAAVLSAGSYRLYKKAN